MKLHINPGFERFVVRPEMIEASNEESCGRVEGDPRNPKANSQVVGPAEEEIGEEGCRGVRVGVEPLDYGVLEFAESCHDWDVSMVADVLDVLDARRDGWVVWERED